MNAALHCQSLYTIGQIFIAINGPICNKQPSHPVALDSNVTLATDQTNGSNTFVESKDKDIVSRPIMESKDAKVLLNSTKQISRLDTSWHFSPFARFSIICAENTHLRGKYNCIADLLFDWFGCDQTNKIFVNST